MNQGYYQGAQSPTMKGGSLPSSPHLKSCLRQGSFSRGIISVSPGGGGASTKTHSSAPSQAMLKYQYEQSRQEEEYSTRSAVSDPTMRSTRDFSHRAPDQSTSYSPSSAPTVGGATRRSGGRTINDVGDSIAEESEMQFARISRILVSQHMSGSHHNDSSYASQLLHHHLPSVQQRMSFHKNLQRNAAHLPMFPEPNEHPSTAMTRYIDKIFGPILAQEVKNGTGDISGIGQSSMNYAAQRYPQHYDVHSPQHDPYTARILAQEVQTGTRDINGIGQSSMNYSMQRLPQHYSVQSPQHDPSHVSYRQQSPLHRNAPYSFDMSRLQQPISYGTDQPMFPPPHMEECGVNFSPTSQVLTNREIPPSISINHPPVHHSTQTKRGVSTHLSVSIPSPLSVSIPSPASLSASMLPTPMASNTSTKAPPMFHQPSPIFQQSSPIFPQPHSVTFASENRSLSNNDTPRSKTTVELRQYQMGPQSNGIQSNDPSQTTASSKSSVTTNSQSLIDSCADSTSTYENERDNGQVFADGKKVDNTDEYQSLSNKDMLPPMRPRETILYLPLSPKSPCCDGVLNISRHQNMRKRPPSYLQLYVKCERSEPFINKDLDIVTWYRNASDSRVTADRTLVVRGTTNLMELICGIVESFGLTSSLDDDACESASNKGNELSLGCYKGVCFVSDIKIMRCKETAKINLTPLPIPGLHYKYVDRSGDDTSNREKKGTHKSSSVLSMDPYGLRRTLVAQLLDKSALSPKSDNKEEEGTRNRLALVYCAPKRSAHVSLRSTHQGVLPETIYHFQLILEGIVNEDDLPSSFQSQTAIRCVGATGGVLGGSVIDTKEEIDELNRALWKGRDVVGLSTPKANRLEKLEQIIDMLGVPLFDLAGNQTPKEFVVDRCLYNIYSGKLSMEVAQKTQDTVEAIEGTTEWLARRVDALARTLTACEDSYLSMQDDKLDEFDAAVSRLEKKWVFT